VVYRRGVIAGITSTNEMTCAALSIPAYGTVKMKCLLSTAGIGITVLRFG